MNNPLRFLRVAAFSLALYVLFPSTVLAQKVLLLGADDPVMVNDVRVKLQSTGVLTQVDVFDVAGSTPTLDRLLGYDAVLTWSNYGYADGAALGDVLADYVDHGKGVVQAAFAFDSAAPLSVAGRWRSGSYEPFSAGQVNFAFDLVLKAVDPQHPILENVVQFDGGAFGLHDSGMGVSPCAQVVARWSNDQPAVVACSRPQGGHTVGLNFLPPSSDVDSALWTATSDGARLMANALRFAAALSAPANSAPTADAGADITIEATSAAGAAFSLAGSGADPDGDALSFSWAGAAAGTGNVLSGTLLPPSAGASSQGYSFTLTVSDGHGGETSDDVMVMVTDTTAPVLANVPAAVVTVPAGADPAATPYGPVTALDAVDGARPVSCLPAAPYAVGDTIVTCSSSDTHGNGTSASFTVRVPRVSTPGAMVGVAVARSGVVRYEVAFSVREQASGERARLDVQVLNRRPDRHDRFTARTTDSVAFSDDPSVTPGRGLQPQVDTVLFSGTGEWNGRSGYRYQVCAVDRGDLGFQRDSLRLTITSPGGTVVAQFSGVISGGFIESERVRR